MQKFDLHDLSCINLFSVLFLENLVKRRHKASETDWCPIVTSQKLKTRTLEPQKGKYCSDGGDSFALSGQTGYSCNWAIIGAEQHVQQPSYRTGKFDYFLSNNATVESWMLHQRLT